MDDVERAAEAIAKAPPTSGATRASGRPTRRFEDETRRDAFVALGPVRYVTHTGERPLGITWKLETLIPAALFEKFAALLAA